MPSPYPIRSDLLRIVLSYRNEKGIADIIAPYSTVKAEVFDWYEYDIREDFTISDDEIGRTSSPNEITFSATRRSGITVDRGLATLVPRKDKMNAQTSEGLILPLGNATEKLMRRVALNREKRVSDIVFDANSYSPNLQETLNGTDQWSDRAGSTPKDQIMEALDSEELLCRPTHLVLGQKSWTALRQHPQINEAIIKTGATEGNAVQRAVANLFELEGVLVGRTKRDDANPGQAMNLSRLWGKHAALIVIDPLAQISEDQAPTFMMTARFGQRIVDTDYKKDKGLHGSDWIKAGESVKELVVSQHCGYFFQNVVA